MLFLTNRFFDLKNLLNPFVFFYLYQTVFCFIALSYHDKYSIEISDELEFFIVVSYFLTFLGAFISRYLFQRAGIAYVRYNDIFIQKRPSSAFLNAGVLLFLLALGVFFYFTFKTGGPIIFGDEIENARIEKRKGSGMLNVIFISFFLYSYLVLLLSKKLSFGIKFLIFSVAAFALLSFGSRAPMIKLILAIFLLAGILSKKKITISKYVWIGSLAIVLVIVLGAFRTNLKEGIDFMDLVIARAGWRPFVNIQNLQRIFDFFPENSPYLYGESYLIDLKIFLPGSNPNFGSHLKDIMNWRFDGGSITPTFLGIGYINFGRIAFIIYPLIFGFWFNSIYQLMCYKPATNNFKIIFLILFSIGISGSLSTGILPALIANTLFLAFTVVIHIFLKQVISKTPGIFRID